MDDPVLDAGVIKDLSNHIYEKRKATAFQIENLTKVALARNDSRTIYKIIKELTQLSNGGSTSTRMGAITALGSVSVALGSFAIAYFLDDIARAIFATFRDTDARIRYYACESLYNIAKIARGEVLRYFNEIFDILCILVTDTESSVKNAADILDRLIKDIVSAKATNYVSIIDQQGNQELNEGSRNEIISHYVSANGEAYQVNEAQDTHKAFSLPKFIPTLLERMYTIDPFTRKFLISWLELLDDIPTLELITFLPNFLDALLRFFLNSAPSDVRLETHNLLDIFLKEIKSLSKVKVEARKKILMKEIGKRKQENNIQDGDLTKKDDYAEKVPSKIENESKKDNEKKAEDENREASATEETDSIKSTNTTIIYPKDDYMNSDKLDDSELDSEYLVGQNIYIDFPKIISILLSFLRLPSGQLNRASSDYEVSFVEIEDHEVYLEVEFTILKWLKDILDISPTSIIKCLPECVTEVLKNISYTDINGDKNLRNEFIAFNLSLQRVIDNLRQYSGKKESDSGKFVDEFEINGKIDEMRLLGLNHEIFEEFTDRNLGNTCTAALKIFSDKNTNELGKIISLDWLIFLYSFNSDSFFKPLSDLEEGTKLNISQLLESTLKSSNELGLKILQLISEISMRDSQFFKDLILQFVNFCQREMGSISFVPSDQNVNERLVISKIKFIVRQFCLFLSSEKIFAALAEVLIQLKTDDLEFLSKFIVSLNSIMLTSDELATFRKRLKNSDFQNDNDWDIFAALFECWCYNPTSAISLCLLTSNYELAYLIIQSLSEVEVNFELLTQLDILIQLLESPIFLKLRLQLLEPEKNPYLSKCLYGILMILPQSSTFNTLKNRLALISGGFQVTAQHSNSLTAQPNIATVSPQNSNRKLIELLEKFRRAQEKREAYDLNQGIKDLSLRTE